MGNKVTITPGFCLTGATVLLLLPLRWTAGGIFAAAVHELFHCITLFLCGGHVVSMSLSAFGARTEVSLLSPGEEALCALAGPVGSFSMILLSEYFPEAALCGLLQGAYNLLPIYPLDGGRILNFLLPECICTGIRVFTYIFLIGLSLWIMTINLEIGLVFFISIWITAIRRKISCKAA